MEDIEELLFILKEDKSNRMGKILSSLNAIALNCSFLFEKSVGQKLEEWIKRRIGWKYSFVVESHWKNSWKVMSALTLLCALPFASIRWLFLANPWPFYYWMVSSTTIDSPEVPTLSRRSQRKWQAYTCCKASAASTQSPAERNCCPWISGETQVSEWPLV